MPDIHILIPGADDWFLRQQRKDALLKQTFKAGDWVVVCRECKKVWLYDIWQYYQKCPGKSCGCEKTVPLSKKALEFVSHGRVHICSCNVPADGREYPDVPTKPKTASKTKRSGSSHFLKNLTGKMMVILILLSVVLTIVLNLVDLSALGFYPRIYYEMKYQMLLGEMRQLFKSLLEAFGGNLQQLRNPVVRGGTGIWFNILQIFYFWRARLFC